MKKILIVSAALLVISGCGGNKDEKLSVNILGSSTDLIDAKTTSCSGTASGVFGDVAGRYFRLSAPTLTWSGAETEAHITAIRFTLSGGPTGDIKLALGGDEILALFGISPSSNSDAILPATGYNADGTPKTVSKTLACQLIVGGISLDPKITYPIDFNATGVFQGFERNPTTGDESEFRREFYFTVRYSGF